MTGNTTQDKQVSDLRLGRDIAQRMRVLLTPYLKVL